MRIPHAIGVVTHETGYNAHEVYCLLCCVQVIQAGMFDQKSTTSERKAFLEALLEEEGAAEEVRVHNIFATSLH